MPHCHCGGHGFDSRTYRIYCTFGRVVRLRLLICARNCDKGSNPLGCTYYVEAGFRGLSPAGNKKERPPKMRL